MARLRQQGSHQLPKYVMHRNGKYYLEPKGTLREKLGGKASFPLGRSYGEMYQNYNEITKDIPSQTADGYTLSKLVHEYLRNVSATKKAESTYKTDIKTARTVLSKFFDCRPEDITTHDIYQYQEKRKAELQTKHKDLYAKRLKEKYFNAPESLIPDNAISYFGNKSVNKEIAFLSSVMRYAARIGVVERSPCIGIEYLKEEPRRRYITDKELEDFCAFARDRNPMLAAYIRLRYITGRRNCEVMPLRQDHVEQDGIVFLIAKQKGRGIRVPYLQEWNDDFREAYEEVVDALRKAKPSAPAPIGTTPTSSSGHLICSRKGTQYSYDGLSGSFNRIMNAAIQEKVLEVRFTLHDIRSKTGTDIDDLAEASRVLAHLDSKTTRKHYRRQVERIKALDTKARMKDQ